ncbi:MAG: glutathione synthase, partial [Neisseriaceae bacterium]|nr:glutathione synthase [Neisseriaceae bacterium]
RKKITFRQPETVKISMFLHGVTKVFKMNILFIADPLSSFKTYKDTTYAMMREMAKRNWHLSHSLAADLSIKDGMVLAETTPFEFVGAKDDHDHAWFNAQDPQHKALTEFDAIVVRTDPPFDMQYLYLSYMLTHAEWQGAKVFNSSRALRDFNEKMAILRFPQWIAPTIVTTHDNEVRQFLAEHGDIIIKPLNAMGGAGIFRLTQDDPNIGSILEMMMGFNRRTIMAQRYIPAICEGDKRVLIIGGEVVPYALARIPQQGETRGNLAAGGKGVAQLLTDKEKQLAQALAPDLLQNGILLAGIDVIGGFLTEINVTSPTCFQEISQQTGLDITKRFADAVEQAVSGSLKTEPEPEDTDIKVLEEPVHERIKLAENKDTPDYILQILAGDTDEKVRWHTAKNPATPPQVLRTLAADNNAWVRGAAMKNPHLPNELLIKQADSNDSLERAAAARNPNMPPEILEKLVGDHDALVRHAVAENPKTPLSALQKMASREYDERIFRPLATHKDATIRAAVAKNVNTPMNMLWHLAEDADDSVRQGVAENSRIAAGNPHTPPETLRQLAKHKDDAIRLTVAENSATPLEALRRLAKDKSDEIRIAVAENTNCDEDLLRQLADDGFIGVRQSVTRHKKVSIATLKHLAEDKEAAVRRAVACNSRLPHDTLEQLGKDRDDRVRATATRDTNELQKLADNLDAKVRRAVAENLNTPAAVLRQLSDDTEPRVRAGVAENINMPADLMRKLSNDPEPVVRMGVAINSNASEEILRRLSDNDDERVRMAVAINANTPAEVLAKMAEDKRADMRQIVAENPNTSADTLKKLVADKNAWVRELARNNANFRG